MEKITVAVETVETENTETVEHKSALKFFAHSMQSIKDKGVDTLTLVSMAQNGDADAMEQLFGRYYRVILSVYYRHRDFGGTMNESEILSACMDGFTKAVNDYQGQLMTRSFIGVLYARMRTEIAEMLAKIGKPISYSRTTLLRVKWIGAMLAKGKKVPEIAEKLDMSVSQVLKLAGLNNQLEVAYGDDELNKIISVSDEKKEKVDNLYEAISLLELKDKLEGKNIGKVMRLSVIGYSLQEIADKLGKTLSYVKHAHVKGIDELRALMN